MRISKIGVKVFSGQNFNMQKYYGIKVFDSITQTWRRIDESHASTEKQAKLAQWSSQSISANERLVGFYFKKSNNGSI